MDYNEDMKIDETALDVVWLDQTDLAVKYAKYSAKCRKLSDLAEEKVKVVRSKLIKKVNQDPEKYLGVGVKINDKNVEAYYRTHPLHMKAKADWIKLKFNCSVAENAKNEVCFTRKAALEALVTLHGQQYFAGPSFPRNLEEIREEMRKEADAKIGARLNKPKEKMTRSN